MTRLDWQFFKSTPWQGLTSTDLLQIITTGYERFWLVRPSGIVVFRKCNSSRTARCTEFREYVVFRIHLLDVRTCITGKLWFPNFLSFCIYNLFVVKDKGIYKHICRKFWSGDSLRVIPVMKSFCVLIMHTLWFILCSIVK